jgi:thiamine-monophosphate kinase
MYRGFLAELNPFNAVIIGGNVTESPERTVINITLIGEVEQGKMVTRSTANVGDLILVTGYPGHAAAGRKLLTGSTPPEQLKNHFLVRAYTRATHRAWEGSALANAQYASAMIDISDGLLGDLGHLCRASNVGAVLWQKRLPISAALKKAAGDLDQDPYDLVLQDSDDYELIITCSPNTIDTVRRIIGEWSDVLVSEVGEITEPSEGMALIDFDGERQRLNPKGWNHFSVS